MKGPERLFKVEKTFYFFVIDSYLKEQQQLKGMQSSKQGMCKGYHLSIEGIRKGYLFCKKWYIKGKGLDLGAEPPGINIC